MSSGFFTEAEMLKYVGERCDEQMAGCPTCRAWTRFDLINHMRDEDEDMRIQFENEEIEARRAVARFLVNTKIEEGSTVKAEIDKWNEMMDKQANDYLDSQKRDKQFAVPINVYVWANSPDHAKEIVRSEIDFNPAVGIQWLDHILDVEDKTHG